MFIVSMYMDYQHTFSGQNGLNLYDKYFTDKTTSLNYFFSISLDLSVYKRPCGFTFGSALISFDDARVYLCIRIILKRYFRRIQPEKSQSQTFLKARDDAHSCSGKAYLQYARSYIFITLRDGQTLVKCNNYSIIIMCRSRKKSTG